MISVASMPERNASFVVSVIAAWLIGGSAAAQEDDAANTSLRPDTATSICLMAEAAATANGLPFEFFARLIWQESRFRPEAVGPVTRSGARARGIAQFMPRTASERGLLDPHDPVQALPKSAEFLRELLQEFGNLGLAAAAYNAGPRRVRDWLEGRGSLPSETQRYVETITGRPVEEWAKAGEPAAADKPRSSPMTCATMTAMMREAPSLYLSRLTRQIEKSAASPWGVQVSAGFSRERALASFSDIEKRHRESLGGLDPIIIQTTLRSRGTHPFYQVRIGADTRAGADRLCADLRKGGNACMVLRNRA
jgi:transglycosylase-like protein with SLT domain/sporulation related protein